MEYAGTTFDLPVKVQTTTELRKLSNVRFIKKSGNKFHDMDSIHLHEV